MELNFKIENLKVTIGTELLEFKTRDVKIFEFSQKLQKVYANTKTTEKTKEAEVAKIYSNEFMGLLESLIVSGDKNNLKLLNQQELSDILTKIMSGFQD